MPSIQYFQKSESVKNVFSVKPIIFGTVTAVVISIVLLTSASLLFLYSGISQNFIPIASKLILFLSIKKWQIYTKYSVLCVNLLLQNSYSMVKCNK